ncbi:unnamed protein product, partial [Choristocarpus tenellus]
VVRRLFRAKREVSSYIRWGTQYFTEAYSMFHAGCERYGRVHETSGYAGQGRGDEEFFMRIMRCNLRWKAVTVTTSKMTYLSVELRNIYAKKITRNCFGVLQAFFFS